MKDRILYLIATETLGSGEIASRIKLSQPYVSVRKRKLEQDGLIYKIKTKSRNKHRCTPKGFRKLGLGVINYEDEKIEIKLTDTDLVNDRRMTVLGYLTFDIKAVEIADILDIVTAMAYQDMRSLRDRGLLIKNKVTERGMEMLSNYDGNYGLGRIKG